MFQHEIQLRVRYGETDQMGYAYYGNYPLYYEVARVECFRHAGLSYKRLEDEGIMMPVLESHSYYTKPAFYDELLTIKVSIPEMPKVRITFLYEFFNEQGELIHKGDTRLVFIHSESRRPTRLPEQMAAILAPHFE